MTKYRYSRDYISRCLIELYPNNRSVTAYAEKLIEKTAKKPKGKEDKQSMVFRPDGTVEVHYEVDDSKPKKPIEKIGPFTVTGIFGTEELALAIEKVGYKVNEVIDWINSQ